MQNASAERENLRYPRVILVYAWLIYHNNIGTVLVRLSVSQLTRFSRIHADNSYYAGRSQQHRSAILHLSSERAKYKQIRNKHVH